MISNSWFAVNKLGTKLFAFADVFTEGNPEGNKKVFTFDT
jgi:hypothetical protein